MAKYLDETGLSKAFELINGWVTTNFLTDVSYNSTSKKIQKTKNGTTSDVVALATVATSGSYDDLSSKPTIPGDFTGATSSAAGTHGLVPAPASGNQTNILFGNGNWKPLRFAWNYDDDYVVYLVRKESANTHTVLDSMTLQLANSGGTNHHGLMSSSDKTKLDGIASGAEVNVQSNWTQTNSSADDYIKNKPTLGTAAAQNVGSVADGNTGLVTGDAVYDAIQDALSDVAGALVYKGTVANAYIIGGTNYKKGWYWIASAAFALSSSIYVEPGDMIIAKQDKTSTLADDIDVIQTNIDTLTTAEVTALWNAA